MNSGIYRNRIRRALIATALACLLPITGFAGGHTGAKAPTVTLNDTEQQALRSWFEGFVADMDSKYFGRVAQLNDTDEVENRTAENEWSDFELRVARGDVMEKAGRMLSDGKKQHPSRGDGELTWSRFYSLDMHPKTPLVGMLHATIVLQTFADDSVQTGGWLGVMPGTKVEIDLAKLKQITDDYFAKHDKDPTLYRRLICKGTHDTIAEFRRKPACSGVSFYGPPVYRDSPEKSIKFIAGLYDEFVDAFVDITAERADDPFTEADQQAQDHMRKAWLIDQLFSDPFASMIVPFDVWSYANVAPIVKF